MSTLSQEEFSAVVDEMLEHCREVLGTKNLEYATEENKLHNFVRAADMLGISMGEAIISFMTKHLVSIFDMVQNQGQYPIEQWDEKIGDAINYLLILRGLIEANRPPMQGDGPVSPFKLNIQPGNPA